MEIATEVQQILEETIGGQSPAVVVVSDPGLGAVAQVHNAIEGVNNTLGTRVKMAPGHDGYTQETLAFLDILPNQLVPPQAAYSPYMPVEDRLVAANAARHTIVMIDATDAPQQDLDHVIDLLNTRKFGSTDLSTTNVIVVVRDAQWIDQITGKVAVVFNDEMAPPPLSKARVEQQREGTLLVAKPEEGQTPTGPHANM